MTDKKFTDEEIIKALEDYIKENEFEYFHSNMMGEYPLIRKSLSIINSQKAEIERVQRARLKQAQFLADQKEQKCELIDKLSQARVEAYKEFAEKIKQEIKEAYDSNIEALNEHFEKHRGCFNDTFVGIIEGKNNALLGLSDFIDNLLKEMVGEE